MARLLIVIALAACTRTSEKYCGLHPEDRANCPQSDASISCVDDSVCPAMAPHCLVQGDEGRCVGCIDNSHCTAVGQNSCDPETRICRSCVEHADCKGSSNVCLPEGKCANSDDVIYVDGTNGTDVGDCSFPAPCKTIAFALGKVIPTIRFHVKLSGLLTESVLVNSKRVVFLADPMTKLVGVTDPVFKVQKSAVDIDGLEITTDSGLSCLKSEMASTTVLRNVFIHGCLKGIEVKGGYMIASRSRVADNTGGGFLMDAAAQFAITNNFIYRNGTTGSAIGGVSIASLIVGMNRFEHNTVVDNLAKAPSAGGVTCPVSMLELSYNIIAGNSQPDTIGCSAASSLVGMDTAPFMFAGAPDYHLKLGSIAIDQIPISTANDDIDGQFRPIGPSKDYGADEFKP